MAHVDPLHPEWEERVSAKHAGKVYYYNNRTGISQWTRPLFPINGHGLQLETSTRDVSGSTHILHGSETGHVAAHYDAVKEQSRETRRQESSPDLNRLRDLNNGAKAVLIETYVSRGADVVMDLCCGKGADLQKYQHIGVKHVVGVDISASNIEAAKTRASSSSSVTKFTYLHGDVRAGIPSGVGVYNAISMQFALHYFFDSEQVIRNVLQRVSLALVPNGYFFGTTVDAATVKHRATVAQFSTRASATTGSMFGNALYGIHVPVTTLSKLSDPVAHVYNLNYEFWMEPRVNGCQEYLVSPTRMAQIGAECGLRFARFDNLSAYLQSPEVQEHPAFKTLCPDHVQSPSSTSRTVWDTLELYCVFVLQKLE